MASNPINFNLFDLDGNNGFVINGIDPNDFIERQRPGWQSLNSDKC